MRIRVFSPTYPTWALVGGTSRPAGETVCVLVTMLPGYQVPDYAEYEPRGEVGTCVKRLLICYLK